LNLVLLHQYQHHLRILLWYLHQLFSPSAFCINVNITFNFRCFYFWCFGFWCFHICICLIQTLISFCNNNIYFNNIFDFGYFCFGINININITYGWFCFGININVININITFDFGSFALKKTYYDSTSPSFLNVTSC